MAKTLVKLICYLELDHKDGLDPRVVNQKVRELLHEDWSNFFNEVRVKPIIVKQLSKHFQSDIKAKFSPEDLIMKRLLSSDNVEGKGSVSV